MTMLVHEAIQKYINPTRYRQIIETESSERLTVEEQRFISEDQKHSSQVAKVYYKKKQSRQVAIEGKKCMDKMTRDCRSQTGSLMEIFSSVNTNFDQNVLEKSQQIIGAVQVTDQDGGSCSKDQDPYQPIETLNDSTDFHSESSQVPLLNEHAPPETNNFPSEIATKSDSSKVSSKRPTKNNRTKI